MHYTFYQYRERLPDHSTRNSHYRLEVGDEVLKSEKKAPLIHRLNTSFRPGDSYGTIIARTVVREGFIEEYTPFEDMEFLTSMVLHALGRKKD